MAKDTAKKNVIANASRLKIFLIITIAVNAVWLISPLISFFGDKPSETNVAVEDSASNNNEWSLFQIIFYLSFWAGQEYFAYIQLYKAGQPSMDASTGKISDCIDLSDPAQLGLLSYAQDLLWVCWGLQLLTQYVSSKFWLLYFLIPVFAVYKIFTGFIKPMLGMAGQAMGNGQQQQGQDGSEQFQQQENDNSAQGRFNKKREELRNKGGRK